MKYKSLLLHPGKSARPAPAELPQDRKVARVGGCSGAMFGLPLFLYKSGPVQVKFKRAARLIAFFNQSRFEIRRYFYLFGFRFAFGRNNDLYAGSMNRINLEKGFAFLIFFFEILMNNIRPRCF